MPEPEPIHDDDGQHIGWSELQSDGGLLTYDLDGDLIGLATDDGQWFGVDELEFADDDGQAAALDQRLDALEAAVSEPRQAEYYPVPVQPERDPDQVAADLYQQAAHWERTHDRPMTLAEKRRVGAMLTEAAVAGEERPDVQAAVDRLNAEGRGLPDIDEGSVHQQRAKRQQLMTEMYADRERADAARETGDDLASDVAPPSQEAYDLDDREQRQRYLLDRLEGREVDTADTFSGSDFQDAERWEEDQ
jgi:hypothetical protein